MKQVEEIKQDTVRIEDAYRQKQLKKRQRQNEKEELSQRWLAPAIMVGTLLLGYLLKLIF